MTAAPPEADEVRHSYPVADADRRFYGFVLDRLLLWVLYAVVALVAYHFLIDPGRLVVGIVVIAAAVVLGWAATALAVGLAGVTPGGSAVGLRIVSVQTGGPIGIPRALLRGLILGVATLPTFGFATAALAVTAIADPSGRRRGWHDLRAGSVVVDIRPEPVEVVVEEETPSPIVNLTALRLKPASPHPPTHTPARRTRAPEKPLPPRLGPATPSQPVATVTPRQGLGWPLVGTAPDEQAGAPATLRPVAAEGAQPGPAPMSTAEVSAAVTPSVPAPVEGGAPEPPPRLAPAAAASGARADRARHAARPGPAKAGWRVAFDTGEAFEVAGLTLVGRRPEARADEPAKRLVTLPSDDMSLSKTHAQFQVVPDGALVVMDRGSTNGSILIRGGVTKQLSGGRPQTLRDGDRVRFGDREMTVARLGA